MDKVRIAIDAMGGDNSPSAPVEGALAALAKNSEISVILLGDEAKIKEALKGRELPEDSQIIHCSEAIEMAEPPVAAISKKKDSSIVKGMYMVRRGEADCFISAGSTGAILVGGQVIVGRIKGVERPPLGALMPTENGMTLLIDCGANVDARASWLAQFARMGSIYMKYAMGIESPTVGLLNIGAEEEKGNALIKETFPLLAADPEINFVGAVEARDVPVGGVDVIVSDAWSGNIVMKMYEGTAHTIYRIAKKGLKSSILGMIGGAIAMGPLKKCLKDFDASKYGGAPLLGLKGLVVKAHGSSGPVEFEVALEQCRLFYKEDINSKIAEAMQREKSGEEN